MKRLPHFALVLLVLSSLLYFFSYPGADNDLWGHLYFGQEILLRWALPPTNLYSYTAPGHPWINHEWLSEVIFHGVYSALGSPGLVLLKVLIGSGIVWMLNEIIRTRVASPWVRVFTLVWLMALLSPGFNVRPQIFTYLLFTVFLYAFHRHNERRPAVFYWTPLLTVLWVNLHGGFVAGLGALMVFSFFNLVVPAVRKDPIRRQAWLLGATMGLCLLALLLNPYGWRLLRFLWDDLRIDRPITEWGPVPLWDGSFFEFKLAILFVLFSIRKHSWLKWDLVLTLITIALALRHQRHSPLFALAAAPCLALGMETIIGCVGRFLGKGKPGELSVHAQRFLVAGILVITVLQLAWLGRVHWANRFQIAVNPSEYPVQATDFLRRNRIGGNIAVPFDWGEYLIWKLSPHARVSIDGRYTTAYPMGVIETNWEWMRGGERWSDLFEHYPTEVAITNRYHPVTGLMQKDARWVYIYSDPISFIFIRDTPEQAGLLESFRSGGFVKPEIPTTYFPG